MAGRTGLSQTLCKEPAAPSSRGGFVGEGHRQMWAIGTMLTNQVSNAVASARVLPLPAPATCAGGLHGDPLPGAGHH